MMSQPQFTDQRTTQNIDAWIFGSGTEALASAVYLIKDAKVHPPRIHIIDKHLFSEQISHRPGSWSDGYDQFAACLPVPAGLPMERLLASLPSTQSQGPSLLDEIQTAEANRVPKKRNVRTCFLAMTKGSVNHIPTDSLNLSTKHRIALIRLLCKRERYLSQRQVQDLLPEDFFQCPFWAIWSAQFGFQPWHSAAELRRSIRQYLPQFHSLSILSCLDITGYYQYESLYLPIYNFLQSCGVDFRYGVEVKDMQVSNDNVKQKVIGFNLVQGKLQLRKQLGENDIVIINIGSTISGSAVGTNNSTPVWQSLDADDLFDQNWSVWLDLGNKHKGLGNPYNFCTRQSESMMESFTITTQDLVLYDDLRSLSKCTSEAGAFIFLGDSNWKINLCIPAQPVFSSQPQDVRVLWGFAHAPRVEGNYVRRILLHSSGADILSEILAHLNLHYNPPLSRTVTIPRAMPRMGSLFLTRALNDRPSIMPLSNVGLVGPFTELSGYTCADVSYGIRTAKMAVYKLMGLEGELEDPLYSSTSIIKKILFWR
jgi:oleate hydratase